MFISHTYLDEVVGEDAGVGADGAPVPPGLLAGDIGDGVPDAEAELVLVLRLVGIQHLHLWARKEEG